MYRPLSAFAVRILTPIMLPPLYNGVHVWLYELAFFISVCLQCVTTCVWCVIYIQIYMCVYIYISQRSCIIHLLYCNIVLIHDYLRYLSCTIYQSYIRLYQPYHFKFSNLNLIISFVFANCFTQTFNILSLNSTSNNAASSPIKCHSWQSRHICWYATYDTLLSYIHTTLHFTALYYTAHILHSSMIFVVPPQGYGPRRSTWALFISPVSWLFMNKNLYTFYTFLNGAIW